MKYSITLHATGLWYVLNTNFIITPVLVELICMCKGIEVFRNSTKSKYSIEFYIGDLFDLEEVKQNIGKIIDAYIAANPNSDKAEDRSIRDFANENQQYKFLSNYNGHN